MNLCGFLMRSEAVRQETLKRDDFRCQITGVGGPEWAGKGVVQVDHWKTIGSSGYEVDNVKNCITLETSLHNQYKHGDTIPLIRIAHWNPDDLRNGLAVERRSLADGTIGEWAPYPKFELWFYRKQFVQHVKENLGNMHSIQTLTGYHAMTMFGLRLVWKDLYADAAGFDQVVSSLGWDPGEANDIADKHVWLLDHKCQWPEGLTDRQMTEIIDCDAPMTLFDGETESMQEFLVAAAEKSFSDLKNAMIERGCRKAQPFYYAVMGSHYLPFVGSDEDELWDNYHLCPITVIQSRDEQGMKAAIRAGEICGDITDPVVFRIGKCVMNLTSRRNVMKLGDGTKVKVLQWPIPKEDDDARDDG